MNLKDRILSKFIVFETRYGRALSKPMLAANIAIAITIASSGLVSLLISGNLLISLVAFGSAAGLLSFAFYFWKKTKLTT